MKKMTFDDNFFIKSNNIELLLDIYILKLLENEFLSQRLWYVNIYSLIDKDLLLKNNITIEDFRRRVFYNIATWNIKLKSINNIKKRDIRKVFKKNNLSFSKLIRKTTSWYFIDKNLYYKYFLDVKITEKGIFLIKEIEDNLNKNKIFLYLDNLKKIFDYFLFTKKLLIWIVWLISVLFSVIYIWYNNWFNNMIASILNNNLEKKIDYEDDFEYDPHNLSDHYINKFFDYISSETLFNISEINYKEIKLRQVSDNIYVLRLIDYNDLIYYYEIIDVNWTSIIRNVTDYFMFNDL